MTEGLADHTCASAWRGAYDDQYIYLKESAVGTRAAAATNLAAVALRCLVALFG
jgi:hypothetical protein